MIATKEWVKSLINKVLKQNDIYSYTERRIGTWVDGKPLYRKCYNWGTGPNKTSASRSFSQIGIPNGSNIVRCELYTSWNSTGCATQELANNPNGYAASYAENNALYIHSDSNVSTNKYIFILEYTKP